MQAQQGHQEPARAHRNKSATAALCDRNKTATGPLIGRCRSTAHRLVVESCTLLAACGALLRADSRAGCAKLANRCAGRLLRWLYSLTLKAGRRP
jgi:hypothetical protein